MPEIKRLVLRLCYLAVFAAALSGAIAKSLYDYNIGVTIWQVLVVLLVFACIFMLCLCIGAIRKLKRQRALAPLPLLVIAALFVLGTRTIFDYQSFYIFDATISQKKISNSCCIIDFVDRENQRISVICPERLNNEFPDGASHKSVGVIKNRQTGKTYLREIVTVN